MKKWLGRTLALTLGITMLTSSVIVNAAELPEGDTNYVTIEEKVNKNLPEVKSEEVKVVDKLEKVNVDLTKSVDIDDFFASCRLIITSKEDIDFKEDNLYTDKIKYVTRFEDKYIVEYASSEITRSAREFYANAGYDVEVDVVSTPVEEAESKDLEENKIDNRTLQDTSSIEEEQVAKDKDIVVAVLDTGLNDSEEIFANRVVKGYDFTTEEGEYKDNNGHGTSMARIILDVNDNENVKVMPLKVLDDNGKGTTLTAYQGIKYAIEQKVDVINLSMSGVGESRLLQSAINEARNEGIAVIVSAGNDNENVARFTPANIESALTVSAVEEKNDELTKAEYSNYGKTIDYSANGIYSYTRKQNENDSNSKDIVTTVNGTSVSAAYVTSYVALLKQMAMSDSDETNDNLSVLDIENSLNESAIDLGNSEYFGRGYLIKDNIKLIGTSEEDTKLEVEETDTAEDIELNANGGYIKHRDFYVKGLPEDIDWTIQMYAVNDSNAFDQRYSGSAGRWGYTELWMPEGGIIKVWTSGIDAHIVYEECNVENWTPWVQVYYPPDTPNWRYVRTEIEENLWNSDQDFASESHYKGDEIRPGYIDCYAGIGFFWQNYKLVFEPHNAKVTYYPTGGTLWDGETGNLFYDKAHTIEYDWTNGYDTMGKGTGVGGYGWFGTPLEFDFIYHFKMNPTRTGYTFKGWYLCDNSEYNGFRFYTRSDETNLIDYSNRYDDLKNAFGYDFGALTQHFWDCGINEGRTIAEKPDNWWEKQSDLRASDFNTANGYDYGRQILPPGCFASTSNIWKYNFGNKDLAAIAIWQKNGYTVNYNFNNGYTGADGSKSESCEYDTTKTFLSQPSKYKSSTVMFDSQGGSAVDNIKSTKNFLGWDSNSSISVFGDVYADTMYKTDNISEARYENLMAFFGGRTPSYNPMASLNEWSYLITIESGFYPWIFGSGDENDSNNYYQPNKSFRNLCVTDGRTITLTGRWKQNAVTLPTPTREGYEFIGWIIDGDSSETIYNGGSAYTPQSDNDVKFIAKWKPILGKINYKSNGAVDSNGNVYEDVTDEELSYLANPYTTKDGSIFGEKNLEEKWVERDISAYANSKNNEEYATFGAGVTQFKLNQGSVTNTLGTKDKMYSFQGWSADEKATLKDSQSIIHNGIVNPFSNMFYDGVSKENLEKNSPAFNKSYSAKDRATMILGGRNNIINERLRKTEENTISGTTRVADMYAVWDEYPVITSGILTIPKEKLEGITEDKLIDLLNVDVNDREDGNFKNGNVEVKIEAFNEEEFANLKVGDNISFNVIAKDSAGNVTKSLITFSVSSLYNTDMRSVIRYIDSDNYYKDSEEKGALMKNSKWYVDEKCASLIQSAL